MKKLICMVVAVFLLGDLAAFHLMTHQWWKIAIDILFAGFFGWRLIKKPSISSAFRILKEALQEDPDYAWSWHCNIAMAIYDTDGGGITHLVSHEFCNDAAARFMRLCFDVDTSKGPGEIEGGQKL